jgi:4'-phosphopantetheinyl transferase
MNTDKLQWSRAITKELIYSNEVHVWRVGLDITSLQREILLGMLSADEVERAGRFHFERDQKRFIAARGMLRQLLGRYLGKPPQELRFEYTANGKPVLATNAGCDTLHFNLSHSGPLAVYAFTRSRNIGIDIERLRDDIAVGQIAQRFFSQYEISSLERIHINKRSELFFQYWTRKEAFIKAMGKGISFPMEEFDVSLISGRVLSPIALPGDKGESSRWHIQDLFPGNGYAAAIAAEGGDCDLSCWHFSL